MAEEKKVPDVKFLTSLTMAVNAMNDEVKHVQFVITQDCETGELHCYFDVVDPSKIKLAEQ